MFRDEPVLVHNEEPAAGLLLGEAVPLVHRVPDGQDNPATRAASSCHHDPLNMGCVNIVPVVGSCKWQCHQYSLK